METINMLRTAINTDRVRVSHWKKDINILITMLKTRKIEIPYRLWGVYLEGVGLNRMTSYRWLIPRARPIRMARIPKNGASNNHPRARIMSSLWKKKLNEQLDLEKELGEDGMEEVTWEGGSIGDFVALLVTADLATEENVAKVATTLPNEDCSRWKLTKRAYSKLAGITA